MDSLLVAVPALGCVLMMVPMMWFMSRGMKQNGQPSSDQSSSGQSSPSAERGTEVAELQAEVDRLRAEVRAQVPEAAPERR